MQHHTSPHTGTTTLVSARARPPKPPPLPPLGPLELRQGDADSGVLTRADAAAASRGADDLKAQAEALAAELGSGLTSKLTAAEAREAAEDLEAPAHAGV